MLHHVGSIHSLVYSQAFLQKMWGNPSCRNRWYTSPVRRPSKTKRANQPIAQTCTLHIYTEKHFKSALHIGVRILIRPHIRTVCVMDTLVVELCLVSQ